MRHLADSHEGFGSVPEFKEVGEPLEPIAGKRARGVSRPRGMNGARVTRKGTCTRARGQRCKSYLGFDRYRVQHIRADPCICMWIKNVYGSHPQTISKQPSATAASSPPYFSVRN